MTIAEAELFYKKDKKEYVISKNRKFLLWYRNIIKNGYHPLFDDISEIEDLINTITNWYEFKYPNRMLESDYAVDERFLDVKDDLSKSMSVRQLMYRLSDYQYNLMESHYRAQGGGIWPVYKNGEKVGNKPVLFMDINNPYAEKLFDSRFLLFADSETGNVHIDHDISKFVSNDNLTLDELLEIFDYDYSKTLGYKQLKECIFDHKCDLELRNRVLRLVALKLLYSENTIPELGYKRALCFIDEFNKEFNLELDKGEIDKLMNIDDDGILTLIRKR